MPHGGARKNAGRPKGQGKFGEPTKPVRIPTSLIASVIDFVHENGYILPFYGHKVQAGFPSPADDYIQEKIDLNKHLIKNPSATFLVRAMGDSMIGAGIHSGDVLVVDRSLEPKSGKIIIAAVDGQLTVKRLLQKNGRSWLMPENQDFPAIHISGTQDVHIWGVVTNVIHPV